MPIFEVTYPEGALSSDARSKLMEDLTTALLRAERAPDTEFFQASPGRTFTSCRRAACLPADSRSPRRHSGST